jgi:ribosomal protein S18 acetylase RimI-like enzyme
MQHPGTGITVRPASLTDVPQLANLLAILFSQEADFTPDAGKQQRGLRMLLENQHTGMLFCAESAGGVIGMVSILFSVSTAEGGRAAWLEDMIVHPDWRDRGIGRKLLEEALRRAREAGCLRVTLLTDPSNEEAMRFYSRAGFSRSAMVPMRASP